MLRSSARRAAMVSRIEGRAGEFLAETDILANLTLTGKMQTENKKVRFDDVVCLVRQTPRRIQTLVSRKWRCELRVFTLTLRNNPLTRQLYMVSTERESTQIICHSYALMSPISSRASTLHP